MDSGRPQAQSPRHNDAFATTHWSLVLAAARQKDSVSQQALAELCQAYWYPIYAFVRRRVTDVHEAQDLTQSFFQNLLERNTIATADQDRGRFRSFLLTACKRFLVNEWHKEHAIKRGGSRKRLSLDFELGESKYAVEAIDSVTPEQLYEQQWAITLLARVLEKLKNESVRKNKLDQFDQLKQFLSGSRKSEAYAEAGVALNISDGAAKVAAHRLRSRYRELLRAEIAQTVESPEAVEDEIHNLFSILGTEKN